MNSNNKRLLHPALTKNRGDVFYKNTTENPTYSGGHFSLCNIEFDISWDPKDRTWFISSINEVTDLDAKNFLKKLYLLHEEGFSDELELCYRDIKKIEHLYFFSGNGEKWITTKEKMPAIGIDVKNGFPNGEFFFFEDNTIVYVDSKEYTDLIKDKEVPF